MEKAGDFDILFSKSDIVERGDPRRALCRFTLFLDACIRNSHSTKLFGAAKRQRETATEEATEEATKKGKKSITGK